MNPVRTSARRLADLLESSPTPVYAVDDGRKIMFCNRSCCQWLGVSADELLGSSCAYHSGEGVPEEWTAALCPPPETFLGQAQVARVVWSSEGRSVSERTVQFLPLGSEVDCVGVLAVAVGEATPSAGAADDRPAWDSAELHLELQRLASAYRGRYRLDRLVGRSPTMRRVRDQVEAAIRSRAKVLVVGPEGSGREHVARAIHYGQGWDETSLLFPLSCSLLDADLLRTSLRALQAECRRTPVAPKATLLLLDIDRATAAAWGELKEVLQPSFPARTMATARHPLVGLARDEQFDRELALALSTIVIELPPLSERREDIPYLAQQQLELWNASHERQMSGFVPAVLDRLTTLPWPRNVDELAEVVDAACQSAAGVWIREVDLPERVRMQVAAAAHPLPEEEHIDLDALLKDIERELVSRALHRARGNKTKAARLLGIHRARLLRRLVQLGLEPEG